MNPRSLSVSVSDHSYPIFMGAGLLEDFREYLPGHLHKKSLFVVCDRSVKQQALKVSKECPLLEIESGEAAKSLKVLETILEWLLTHKIDRSSAIISVGGGVTGDLVGFAASIVLRGVPIIHVPTTLLSMVDSSVGGKTGINMPQGKNLVGSFHQPDAVLCDFNVLRTLPEREMKSGYAEILKYALLGDVDFFTWLESHGLDVLRQENEALHAAVYRSCEMKAQIVQVDEYERSGQRALLNLGHTFAHAFEAYMGYDGRLLHGEAVGVGLLCAIRLSEKEGFLHSKDHDRVKQHMDRMGLKTTLKDLGIESVDDPEIFVDLMRSDKKISSGRIRFVLMRLLGESFLHDQVNHDNILKTLTAA